MVRNVSMFLGAVLLALFVVGVSGEYAASWLVWWDLAAAATAFLLAVFVTPENPRSLRVGGPIAMGVALLVLWIVALSTTGVAGWLTWFNFAVGCAFLFTGLAAGGSATTNARPLSDEAPRFRRSA